MSEKLIKLWVNFASSEDAKPDANWQPINKGKGSFKAFSSTGPEGPPFTILDLEPLREEFPREFSRDMEFLDGINHLVHNYRVLRRQLANERAKKQNHDEL